MGTHQKLVQHQKTNHQIRRCDIYFVDFGDNTVGSEQSGQRPALVVQNKVGLRYSPTVEVAAITSQIKKTYLPTHVVFKCESLPKKSMVMLEQRFTFDKSRLKRYLGRLPAEYIPLVDRAIKIQDGVLDKESMKQFALERKRRREKNSGRKEQCLLSCYRLPRFFGERLSFLLHCLRHQERNIAYGHRGSVQ